MGRDVGGAESVNLAPNDVPQDVYSDVVLLVERERQIDAEGDGEHAKIAKLLEGYIERKVQSALLNFNTDNSKLFLWIHTYFIDTPC